jgi:carbonic anhydrase
VPANEIIDVLPGEVFVHRNVANQVMHVDFNCLAVVQYAVETLAVRHIIVCGHYGCGGVTAALQPRQTSLTGNWLYPLFELGQRHRAELLKVRDSDRVDVLCEINVIEQVRHVCQTTILERAWRRGQNIAVHGWIYGVHNGRLADLQVTVSSPDEVEQVFTRALHSPRLLGR